MPTQTRFGNPAMHTLQVVLYCALLLSPWPQQHGPHHQQTVTKEYNGSAVDKHHGGLRTKIMLSSHSYNRLAAAEALPASEAKESTWQLMAAESYSPHKVLLKLTSNLLKTGTYFVQLQVIEPSRRRLAKTRMTRGRAGKPTGERRGAR